MADCFAGANTEVGYKGYLPDILASADRVFIIKGSPGSGKSTLMKRVAETAESEGHRVDRVFCSADPLSLDAVIVPGLSIAVADGTSPHTMDTPEVGIRDTLIDIGRYLDTGVLAARAAEVRGIVREKKLRYAEAYKFISAAVNASRAAADAVCRSLDREKLERYLDRLYAGHIRSGRKGDVEYRPAAAFTGSGREVADAFPEAETVYEVTRGRGSGSAVLSGLLRRAEAEGEETVVSPSETDSESLNAVYFPGRAVLVCDSRLGFRADRHINMERFIKKDLLRTCSGFVRMAGTLASGLYDSAEERLREAGKLHGILERIYGEAMDFSGIDAEYNRIAAYIRA